MPGSIYGLMAEFEKPERLIQAAHGAYEEGYRHLDAYSPFPIEEVSEAINFHHTGIRPLVLAGGLLGATTAFTMQWIGNGLHYPINVGGRPLMTWVPNIPITFEGGVLLAAFSAVFGMLLLNGFPRPYNPVFNTPNFKRASEDRFFLCIEASDPKFSPGATRSFLQQFDPLDVSEVEY
jgi:hypothetical protein